MWWNFVNHNTEQSPPRTGYFLYIVKYLTKYKLEIKMFHIYVQILKIIILYSKICWYVTFLINLQMIR